MNGIITNFQAPETLEELIDRYENYAGKTNLDIILEDSEARYTNWTVSQNSKKGDIVFFHCASSSLAKIGRACKAARESGGRELIEFGEMERELHKKYCGTIVAWGILIADAEKDEEGEYLGWKSRWFADIQLFDHLENPVPYAAFKKIAHLNSYGAVTVLNESQCDELKSLVETYNPDQQPELETTVVVQDGSYLEGKRIEVYGKKYERNPAVRKAFLSTQKKPFHCAVCGFDFEKTYGELGKDYIEVHHKKPLSVNGREVEINVYQDLVCLCSNCHTMIHRRKASIMTVEELRECLTSAQNRPC